MDDGPFCYNLEKLEYYSPHKERDTQRYFESTFDTTHDTLKESVSLFKKSSTDHSKMGIVISEESVSFILSFISYNNATKIESGRNNSDILVDRVIEADFHRNRKIVIEFETPVFLS